MNRQLLAQLVKASHADVPIDRLGLRGWIGETYDLLTNAALRKTHQAIREDYRQCKSQLLSIAQDVPAPAPGKSVWMLGSNWVWGYKFEAMLLLAFRSQNYSTAVVETQYSRWCRAYHRLMGNRRFIDFTVFQRQTAALEPEPQWREFVNSKPSIPNLIDLTYRNVDIGRIVLSNILYQNKFKKFDITDPDTLQAVYRELVIVQRNIFAAEKMLEQDTPSLGLVLEKGKTPYAELFGAMIAKGIPVIQFNHSQNRSDFSLKRFTLQNRYQHPFSLDGTTWEKVKAMKWSHEQEESLMKAFEESYSKGKWFNRKFLHQGKQIKSADAVREQLQLDPAKKTAVIFSHVLWDATFFYGHNLFDDYETWLIETVRAACKNPKVNWLIKFHPDLVWKLKIEGYSGELRDVLAVRSSVDRLPDHIKIVMPETDISTYSFFEMTDVCLTVRGTIGIEMACHGVPVLTAGTGRYSGLGFTIDCATREDYFRQIASIQDIPPMSRERVELARRFAHTLFTVRPWKLRSFENIQLDLDRINNPLSMNLAPKVRSYAEFAQATDIRRFADWAVSGETDYLDEDLEGMNSK